MCFTQSLIKPAHPNWGSSASFFSAIFAIFQSRSSGNYVVKHWGVVWTTGIWLRLMRQSCLPVRPLFCECKKKHNALVFWKHPKGTLVATDSSLSQGVDRHGWLDSGGPSHFKPWRVWLNNLTLKCSIYRKNPSNPAQIKTCNQHGNIVEHVPMVPSSFQRINLHKLP